MQAQGATNEKRFSAVVSENTYRDLQPFNHFVGQAFDSSYYVRVPSDWLVLVADIVCSTAAIAEGHYENVNFVGAGCVVALTNAIPKTAIPTVFGGDGASAVIPSMHRQQAEKALRQMRDWAEEEFGLELRVGIVPVSVLEEKGASLEMGKMRLGVGNEVAMFRGSALDLADELIKQDIDQTYHLPSTPSSQLQAPDLSSLSCRWAPIKPKADLMLCLIIAAREPLLKSAQEIDQLFTSVVSEIDRVANLDDPNTNPVKLSNLEFKFNIQSILREIKTLSGNLLFRTSWVLVINIIGKLLFFSKLKLGSFDPELYKHEVILNSDFIKVSGMVRLIIDCDKQQSDRIENLLENRFQADEINFGLHRADQALMTCVTPDIANGKHLHYIDATGGGFWSAATDLKRRIQSTKTAA